jgi:hypothetical protein
MSVNVTVGFEPEREAGALVFLLKGAVRLVAFWAKLKAETFKIIEDAKKAIRIFFIFTFLAIKFNFEH